MRLGLFVAAAFAFAGTSAAVQAGDYTLVCNMTDYGTSAVQPDFKQLVPPYMEHEISGTVSQMAGAAGPGQVEEKGSRTKITYFGRLDGVGEVSVEYTFIRSTGIVIAHSRSIRSIPWEDGPTREKLLADYSIRGTCAVH